ncbi:hypothetical protein VTK26DRAFT_8356 [Humicola hyalothermophila]
MLPTPSTSHVPYARVYEPAEDSFLLLDTFSLPSEIAFLASRFPASSPPSPSQPLPPPPPPPQQQQQQSSSSSSSSPSSSSSSPTPLILEIGPGSGVILAFLTAHARALFSRRDVLTLGIDVNRFACRATRETVRRAVAAEGGPDDDGDDDNNSDGSSAGYLLGAAQGDLACAVRPGQVDVLVFNPPYVPTPEVPEVVGAVAPGPGEGERNARGKGEGGGGKDGDEETTFEEDARLLALSYAGGRDGMEITDRLIGMLPAVLSERGCAYLLLCAQNKPEEVKARIRALGGGGGGGGGVWRAETVASSGKQAGWERLQVVRIWRDFA